MTRLRLWVSLTFLGVSTAVWAAGPGQRPSIRLDPAEGQIDGRTAVAFLPIDESDPEDPLFLDLLGCTVHYVPKSNLDAEEVHPCGEWLQPTRGRFFAWLETARWQRTPYVVHGIHSAGSFRGRGKVSAFPLAPAGRVALDEPVSGHSLHLLHLDSHLQGEFPQREVFRRISEADSVSGVLMPEGPVVALLFDRDAEEYVWVSRPATVQARRMIAISPPEASKGTDLFVTLVRSKPVSRYERLDVDIRAGPPGEERRPDVTVPGVYHFYAIWYGLHGRHARLTAATETSYLEPVDVALRPGRVESLVGDLKPLPELEAILDLPPEMPPTPRVLEVLRQGDREPLRRIELEPETDRHVLRALPATQLTVALQSPPWTLSQAVDLSDGADATVTFAPRPIYLEGTVFHGDRPHPATVVFATNRAQDELRVDTDEEGRYQSALFRPGVYVIRVELAGRDGPGFIVFTADEPITESRVLDFHVPANRFEVEVTDRYTGEAIVGAEVGLWNRADEGPTVALTSRTQKDGIAVLSPLRPGVLELDIHAQGYMPREVDAGRVEALDRERRLGVALEPNGHSRELLLLLADRRPAAYAEVRQPLAPGAGSRWRSAADAAGRLEIPDTVRGSTLLIRHPEAAFLARPWQPGPGDETRWQLRRPQPPLWVRVVHSWGDSVPFAQLALKIEGRWWTGLDLAWLTGSRTSARRNGEWTALHLPEAPLALIAWGRGSDPGDLAPLEAVATQVPWPRAGERIEIEPIRQ